MFASYLLGPVLASSQLLASASYWLTSAAAAPWLISTLWLISFMTDEFHEAQFISNITDTNQTNRPPRVVHSGAEEGAFDLLSQEFFSPPGHQLYWCCLHRTSTNDKWFHKDSNTDLCFIIIYLHFDFHASFIIIIIIIISSFIYGSDVLKIRHLWTVQLFPMNLEMFL